MSATSTHNNNDAVPLIILADDDPSIRLILHHILQRDGYRVLDASNGREVLRLHAEHQANLILLDAIMPEQDGFVTCRMLKEQQPELPVLMITALDDDQSVEHAFRVGADDYISKPINWSVLKHRIAHALSLLTPRTSLDERILNNQIDITYAPAMMLDDESIIQIEAHTNLPLSSATSLPAAEHLLKSYCLGYQQEKYLHPTASTLSLPLWPLRHGSQNLLGQLHSLEARFGIPLQQLQLRIHECHMNDESLLKILPQLAETPLQLCIDHFSLSLRNLDFIHQYGCQAVMIDMAQARKWLGDHTSWLNEALRLFKDLNIRLHACNVQQPEDLRLAISLGCSTGSGPAIRTK